jgi:hypothetical protein
VTHFDSYDIDRGIRLLLRPSAGGEIVEIPAMDMFDGPRAPPRDWEYEKDLRVPWCTPIREVGTYELQAWFPLAVAWDRLLPGTWEARVAVEVMNDPRDPPTHPEGTPAPVVWTGTIATEPLPVVIEEAPARKVRYFVPKRLRPVPSHGYGAGVAIGCLDGDRETVDLAARHGLSVGVTVRRNGGGGAESLGGGLIAVADQLPTDHAGPFAGDYEIEIFETGEEPRSHQYSSARHPAYRTLWKRAFRVEATAAEIEALRR